MKMMNNSHDSDYDLDFEKIIVSNNREIKISTSAFLRAPSVACPLIGQPVMDAEALD